MGHSEVIVQRMPVCCVYLAKGTSFKFFRPVFFMYFLNFLCWTQGAPMDTHDIATKPSPQLMVLRHGALSGFCSISILMKRLNAF